MLGKKKKILLVDDEPDILELLKYNLEHEGFQIYTASNGFQAIKMAEEVLPDLILMDVMMPEMDGIEACHQLRQDPRFHKTIIAMLTARSEDYSQIAGFESGADDYITKPIKPRVLISRIRALLRRNTGVEQLTPVAVEGITIDRERYLVIQNDKTLNLPKKEFELLAFLMSKPGRVFTRGQILDAVWGQEITVGDRTIDVHIRKLREKIGSNLITTIKGVGYKLDVEAA